MKNNLPKIKTKSKKRAGRGYGSGKGGHTAGRGQKGQKSRKSLGILFEGVKMKKSLIKRLPIKRGRLKAKASPRPVAVNINVITAKFKKGDTVDSKSLVDKNIISSKDLKRRGVKVLGSIKNENLDLKLETDMSKRLRNKLLKKSAKKEQQSKKNK